NGNRPPVITSFPAFAATVNQVYQYQVTAVDPDDDPLQFLLVDAPAGMSVDPTNGLVLLVPTPAQLRANQVAIRAVDPEGVGSLQTYTVTVFATNHTPNITSSPSQIISLGSTYHYDVAASDPDGDPLSYSLSLKPTGMTIDSFGRVTWQPTAANLGT